MDWQQLVSLLIVGVTALAFLWSKRRSKRPGSLCSHGCGCSPAGEVKPPNVVFHGRKGQRTRVVVKAQ